MNVFRRYSIQCKVDVVETRGNERTGDGFRYVVGNSTPYMSHGTDMIGSCDDEFGLLI